MSQQLAGEPFYYREMSLFSGNVYLKLSVNQKLFFSEIEFQWNRFMTLETFQYPDGPRLSSKRVYEEKANTNRSEDQSDDDGDDREIEVDLISNKNFEVVSYFALHTNLKDHPIGSQSTKPISFPFY